jgi:hypothetical protein
MYIDFQMSVPSGSSLKGGTGGKTRIIYVYLLMMGSLAAFKQQTFSNSK